jgi:hypothetical protein
LRALKLLKAPVSWHAHLQPWKKLARVPLVPILILRALVLAIRCVRQVQMKLMADDHALYDAKILKQLMMTERYERRALTERRRAVDKL